MSFDIDQFLEDVNLREDGVPNAYFDYLSAYQEQLAAVELSEKDRDTGRYLADLDKEQGVGIALIESEFDIFNATQKANSLLKTQIEKLRYETKLKHKESRAEKSREYDKFKVAQEKIKQEKDKKKSEAIIDDADEVNIQKLSSSFLTGNIDDVPDVFHYDNLYTTAKNKAKIINISNEAQLQNLLIDSNVADKINEKQEKLNRTAAAFTILNRDKFSLKEYRDIVNKDIVPINYDNPFEI